jgi:hypothetical protein
MKLGGGDFDLRFEAAGLSRLPSEWLAPKTGAEPFFLTKDSMLAPINPTNTANRP